MFCPVDCQFVQIDRAGLVVQGLNFHIIRDRCRCCHVEMPFLFAVNGIIYHAPDGKTSTLLFLCRFSALPANQQPEIWNLFHKSSVIRFVVFFRRMFLICHRFIIQIIKIHLIRYCLHTALRMHKLMIRFDTCDGRQYCTDQHNNPDFFHISTAILSYFFSSGCI